MQLTYYLRWLGLIEARRAYPSASMEATVLNMMGGKPDPGDPDPAPPRKASLLWSPEERLPPWATLDSGPGVWTTASARDALDHAGRLPMRALAALDFARLRQLAGA